MLASLGGRDASISDILPVPSTVMLEGRKDARLRETAPLEHLCAPTPRGALAQSTAALVNSLAGDKPHFPDEDTETQEGRSLAQGND